MVAAAAARTASYLGLGQEDVERVRLAAELHDIGKAAIPDSILNKPSTLDPEEWEFIKQHTLIGERILAAAPALAAIAPLVRASHERIDGTGYPDGLKGSAIPIGARIVAVADAYDTMVSDRPYHQARSIMAALAELQRCAGSQFDPDVVNAFVAVLGQKSEQTPAPLALSA
jgi:two-component system cell cycle response regulator